jgi:hypothetical protein
VFAFFRTGQPRTIARKFFGVFNGDGMPDGLVSSLIVADVVVGIANLIGPHLSLSDNGTLTYGVVDKTGVFFPVIDSTVSAITAYQRRRRFGRGA